MLYHRLRRTTRERALAECRQLADNLVVHDVTLEVWHRATELVETDLHPGPRLVSCGQQLCLAGFDAIVTTDSDFDGVLGLRRIDPRDTLTYPDAAARAARASAKSSPCGIPNAVHDLQRWPRLSRSTGAAVSRFCRR